jgi:hypothetical protein
MEPSPPPPDACMLVHFDDGCYHSCGSRHLGRAEQDSRQQNFPSTGLMSPPAPAPPPQQMMVQGGGAAATGAGGQPPPGHQFCTLWGCSEAPDARYAYAPSAAAGRTVDVPWLPNIDSVRRMIPRHRPGPW